jgi:hypothetical protein
MQLIF